jgi:hypothetical protein
MAVIKRWVGDAVKTHPYSAQKQLLVITLGEYAGLNELEVALISAHGITYSTRMTPARMIQLPLTALKQSPTFIVPAPYPDFLSRRFESSTTLPLKAEEIEFVQITLPSDNRPVILDIKGIWLQ